MGVGPGGGGGGGKWGGATSVATPRPACSWTAASRFVVRRVHSSHRWGASCRRRSLPSPARTGTLRTRSEIRCVCVGSGMGSHFTPAHYVTGGQAGDRRGVQKQGGDQRRGQASFGGNAQPVWVGGGGGVRSLPPLPAPDVTRTPPDGTGLGTGMWSAGTSPRREPWGLFVPYAHGISMPSPRAPPSSVTESLIFSSPISSRTRVSRPR